MPEVLLGEGVLRIVVWAGLATVGLCLVLAIAAILLRLRNTVVAERWARLERRWESAVLEALEGDRSIAELGRAIPATDTTYFAGFLARFARQLRGPELDRLTALAAPLAPAIRAQLRSGSAERRAQAVSTLGLLSPAQAGPALLAALDDPSLLVAMVAARALARERRPEHAEILVAHLHRFQHWRPGFLAAMLSELGQIGRASCRERV